MYNLEPIAQLHQRKPYGYKVSMAVLQEKGQLLKVIIRHATPNDFAVIRKIERMAGAAFEQYDMSEIANDEPPSIVVLKQYCSEQLCAGWPAGFIQPESWNGYAAWGKPRLQ